MTAQADAITRAIRAETAKSADWQMVTVAAVNSDGTCDVTAADGSTIPSVRRARAYEGPVVGDVVIMHRSRMGSRYLVGVLAAGTGWVSLPLASPWAVHNGSPAYRLMSDGCVRLRGSVKTTASVSGGSIIATLPAGYRIGTFDYRGVVGNAGSGAIATYVQLGTDGTITYEGPTGTISYLFLGGMTYPTM